MSLADYYQRGALAAAQVLGEFDEARFRAKLEETPVGIAFDESALTPEGQALVELLTRLFARLYPRLALLGPTGTVNDLGILAKEINPAINLEESAMVGVSVGMSPSPFQNTIYAGSSGWDALLNSNRSQSTGNSGNPFGAAVAACISAAGIFRRIFLTDWQDHVDDDLRFSAWHLDAVSKPTQVTEESWHLRGGAVLVGGGAIGNSSLWVLARTPTNGRLHLVDPEDVELSNLQRYVLASHSDVGRSKVEIGASYGTRSLEIIPHRATLGEFLSQQGYVWDSFLLALDSARDRRSAQAALPRWIANGWTQPGDLGISTHPRFGDEGACVACMYMPSGRQRNEDEIVSAGLGVPSLQYAVRALLHTGAPLEREFLQEVAGAIGRPLDMLLLFEGRSIRDLYVEGFCGGAVIPMGEVGSPPEDLHVPLAHQSALAGILLAATLIRSNLGSDPVITSATRINVLRNVRAQLAQPIRAKRDGFCICDDNTFQHQYWSKYSD